jgi:hypothetical protein
LWYLDRIGTGINETEQRSRAIEIKEFIQYYEERFLYVKKG